MTARLFDRAAAHIEATAKRMTDTVRLDPFTKEVVLLRDREAVVRFMTTDIKWKARWGTSTDYAPWHMVRDATLGWSEITDLMRGHAFRDALDRALSLGGSGSAEGMAVAPSFDASAKATIRATRQAIIDAHEDGEIDEDDAAILALPPAIIVAVQVRMHTAFTEALREEPELLLSGSVESIQRDIADRWRRVLEWLVAQEAQSA